MTRSEQGSSWIEVTMQIRQPSFRHGRATMLPKKIDVKMAHEILRHAKAKAK